jgi:hypothetical protein
LRRVIPTQVSKAKLGTANIVKLGRRQFEFSTCGDQKNGLKVDHGHGSVVFRKFTTAFSRTRMECNHNMELRAVKISVVGNFVVRERWLA